MTIVAYYISWSKRQDKPLPKAAPAKAGWFRIAPLWSGAAADLRGSCTRHDQGRDVGINADQRSNDFVKGIFRNQRIVQDRVVDPRGQEAQIANANGRTIDPCQREDRTAKISPIADTQQSRELNGLPLLARNWSAGMPSRWETTIGHAGR
jgi:hypothetical protein